MRCEAEVRARLHAGETELRALGDDISRLALEVKVGGDGWRTALETLSTRVERRRSLQAQMESLRWVLASEPVLLAG